jgi:hypothetical protein
MPKMQIPAIAWWPWRRPRRAPGPDAADHGTALGLELSLQPMHTERRAAGAPPRRARGWLRRGG